MGLLLTLYEKTGCSHNNFLVNGWIFIKLGMNIMASRVNPKF